MRRMSIFCFISGFLTLNAFSQQEIYFNTTKPEDIKVETMHGFEVGSGQGLSSLFQKNLKNNKSFNIPLYIGYFNEKRIADCWTLTTRIGLSNSFKKQAQISFFKDSMEMYDSMIHFINYKIDNYKFEYSLGLGISIEPRWYIGYKNQFREGKTKLNSGWYAALPVSISSTLIDTYTPPVNELGIPQMINFGTLGGSSIIGYRHAISKQLFLEGSLDVIDCSFGIYNQSSRLYILQSGIHLFSGISIKAAYTFNK